MFEVQVQNLEEIGESMYQSDQATLLRFMTPYRSIVLIQCSDADVLRKNRHSHIMCSFA